MSRIHGWSILGLLFFISGFFPMWDSESQAATLRLKWQDISNNEAGFNIERLVGSNYVQVASVGANVENYSDANLNIGSTYCYRVRAFNSAGTSLSSNSACATVTKASVSLSTTPTSAPTAAQVSNLAPIASAVSRWSDYAVTAKMQSDGNGLTGLMFRYQDPENYYRFSWSAQDKSRKLEKRVEGAFHTLAEDNAPIEPGRAYTLQVAAEGGLLKVAIDGTPVFSVDDNSLSEGTIALYSNYNSGNSFDDVVVEDLGAGGTLLSHNFNDGSHRGWTFIDDSPGQSRWSAASGALVQSGNAASEEPEAPGTYALYSQRDWKDYRVALKMRSSAEDAIGVMFRYQDRENYYRFSWSQEAAGRQLVKRENGVFKIIAEDAVPYVSDHNYQVEIITQGSALKVNIDGKPVFSVDDQSFKTGTVALYSSKNHGSSFDDIHVVDLATGDPLLWDDFGNGKLTGWTVVDDAVVGGPSAWSVAGGELAQASAIGSDESGRIGTFTLY